MTKIFGIYPTDKQQSTQFLNRINTYLKRELENNWHCYKVKFSDSDHKKCLVAAKESTAKFILFMGHGRSDALYGSCNKESNDFINLVAGEVDDIFYKNDAFVTIENLSQFENKILFSLSCLSNRNEKNSIGRNAILKGIKSFVGFGDIPTDYIEKNEIPLKAISIYKGLITKIVKVCVSKAIINNYSVLGLVDLMKLETNREIQKIIIDNNLRHKDKIIENLYNFKNEIVIFGDPHTKLVY